MLGLYLVQRKEKLRQVLQGQLEVVKVVMLIINKKLDNYKQSYLVSDYFCIKIE